MNQPKIEFTREKLAEFKKEYELAKAQGREVFTFEGHEVLVPYAYWMILYLEAQVFP